MIKIITTIYNKKQEKSALDVYDCELDSETENFMENVGNHNKYPYLLWKEDEIDIIYKLSKEDLDAYSPNEFFNIYAHQDDYHYYNYISLDNVKWLYGKFKKILKDYQNRKEKSRRENQKKQLNCNIIETKLRYKQFSAYIKLAISDEVAQKLLNGDLTDLKLCYIEKK